MVADPPTVYSNSVYPNPVNARATDVFDLFQFKFYPGPNPYLNRGALVFNFALIEANQPLPLETYVAVVSQRYPSLRQHSYDSYASLFARTLIEVGKLDMELHFQHYRLHSGQKATQIAVEALHEPTSYGAAYVVWDWLEAITQDRDYEPDVAIEQLQRRFRRSVYGGPTVYALLRSAHRMGVPAFYLPDEGLMQYGYGKKLVRGIATTFDRDSHLDSDFTTRKDDCKAFLAGLGFPVPKGDIVSTVNQALRVVDRIGYPVAVKPVTGHKGNGVTADVQTDQDLEFAFERAVQAHAPDQPVAVIVERSIRGADYRLLCVNGRFVAAMERQPASVVGDGVATIAELIDQENCRPERRDTPTSPMGKIICDTAMERYLEEQALSLETILKAGQRVYLRKVANLSAGGVSIDATAQVHPDTIVLAQDIAQHFQLVCLGIDVLTPDISRSWQEGAFGIVEINAAPGVYMHLNPAVGTSVDVTVPILETFFASGADARVPIITFNYLPLEDLQELIDQILLKHPHWTIGAICRDGVLINRSEKLLTGTYNTRVQNLLRHPKLDLLIAEYRESVIEQEGLFYDACNLVILNDPTEIEHTLAHTTLDDAPILIKEQSTIWRRREGLVEQYALNDGESFKHIYWTEVAAILE